MKIGLTGSIACGKSTVAAYLHSLGYAIVDADAISRALTAPGGAALPALRDAFGSSIFTGDALDRRALGALVFADSTQRTRLNAILHPLICEEIIARLEAEGIPRNFPGVFHGGPPCQSFSIAANQRFSKNGENFKRTGFDHEQYGNLLFCYIAAITNFMPEAFLIENVDGLLNIDGGIQARRACQILEHAGYDVTPPHIVDAADFGVPQKRMRTIIMGSRIGHIDFPAPVEHHISMGSALVAPILDGDSHSPRNHKAASIDRYMKLNFGQRDKLGRVDRLDPLLPSKTVIAGGTGGGGRSHLHPFIPRTLTVRECARIQTFPDTYRFTGPMSRRFTQVGNAVPPVMAYEMACAIIRSVYQ